jgi:glycosyltransferase involved in cell wall biosynthesis
MKLVYFTTESFLYHCDIIKELRKKNELHVFIQAKERTNEIDQWCKTFNAEYIKRKRFRNPITIFSEIKLMNRLKKINTDKIWFDNLSLYQIPFAKMMLRNFILIIHDVEYHPGSRDYYSKLVLWLTFHIFKKNICVVSRTQADIFEKENGFKPRIFQLPIIDYYKDASLEPHQLQLAGQNLSLLGGSALSEERGNNNVKFFFFGLIEKYKGIETLIEAAEILENKNLSFEVRIYGRLKYSVDKITKRINKLKNTRLINEFIDYRLIHKTYSENDVLIQPHKQVTQCGPLLIAYSENIPLISSDLPGFREYVVDGKSGFIFNGTSQDLADKMEYIIENREKLEEMREYIKKEIYNRFSMKALVNEYMINLS